MNATSLKIIEKGIVPSRADIAELLASIGKPGEHRDEKQAAVRELFDESGYRPVNSQGFHIADVLTSYEAY